MKKQSDFRHRQLAFHGGSYSLLITAMVLVLLIVVNCFVSLLPASVTNLDISSSKLYSITSNTKVVVNHLQQDVTIYWIVQADEEDTILENLLSKYESLSGHIHIVKKNPDVFPTFTEQYTEETVPNNSLIVESGDRSRYISNNDIYEYEFDMSTYSYVATAFDGEGVVTSAIDYVVTEELPQLYLLEGHGEASLPDTFAEAIEKANIEITTFSLLNVDEIPDTADAILIYAPERDIAEEEYQMLSDYVTNGGKLLVIAGPSPDTSFLNLQQLLADYNITFADGFVIENNREYYAFGYPYILMPTMSETSITEALIQENYYPAFPLAQGMELGYTSKGTVTALLSTSDTSFSKVAGFSLTTYEKEEDDVDGPFTLGVSVETDTAGQLIWFSSSDFLNNPYNSYSSGANTDLVMNAISSLIGEREAMAIRSKSLDYNYLTINDATASTLKALMIAVFPISYFAIGVLVILRKRGKQNETN